MMITETEFDITPNEEDIPAPQEYPRALESRALKGTYYVVASQGLAMALRLGSSIILTRLFVPAYFGLMALVTTILVGMNLFSHIGLQDSVIQNPRGDEPDFLNTAWTLQVIRGSILWLVTIPLAWPIARFYHEPRMILLIPILGLGSIIAGFSSPSLLSLARHIGLGRLSALELFSQALQLVITVIWAYFWRSIWVLAWTRVIVEITRTAISYTMMPELRPKFTWEKRAVSELINFGRWILVGTALNFLAGQSDRLILGRLTSMQMLGIYGIAFTLSDIPRQVITQFSGRVGFPFIAKFADRPRPEFRAVVLKYRMMVLAVGAIMLVGVICFGDIFIIHVYDKRWHEAAWMIAILALGLWHTLLYSTISPAIMALQKAHYNAVAYGVYCVTLFAALYFGFHYWGMVGAVAAVAVSDLPVYFVNLYSGYREGVGTFGQDLKLTFGFACLLALSLTLRFSLGFGSPFSHIR
ncbi:O-antigen/teichoic acid export membrane protein [Silvibacterium bohemicum]|uniref:O-antigen/teichoic acid export membrane protein n=1 Tax=Silvibacterium bohemicum TaxID=1577686 RepID=A0A841JXU7_9BACT|nr:oligosaccharide flippase family protein [Silvibacterium bohemicum]MBB6142794.1 O-antigen/teichoic acid export membrane protein [Silvibacterium bohemicum]